MPERRQIAMTFPHLSSRRCKTALRDRSDVKLNVSVHSFDSSLSEPPTPTWSLRSHARYPSSNSSVASSPAGAEGVELSSSCARLSKLAEEPPEPEDDCVIVEGDDGHVWHCLCDSQPCAHSPTDYQRSLVPSMSPVFDFSDSFYGEIAGMASRSSSIRQKADDSPIDNIAQKFTTRFPSFSRRWNMRKPTISLGPGYTPPSRTQSSRSSSLSSTAVPPLDHLDQLQDPFPPRAIDSGSLDEPSPAVDTALDVPCQDPIDRRALTSTPLLPPMIDEARPHDTPVLSPLQSPAVAEPVSPFSVVSSPLGTPQLQAVKTPPLSTKPSIASFRHVRTGPTVPCAEIPPIMMSDPNDPWSIKLGHANFTISPEPYVPDEFTADTVGALFADWERARCNFVKHQVRTGEHYGVNSKIYMLTDCKWAETDALWKKNYELTVAEASRQNLDGLPLTPEEPAPLMKMPSLNDPKSEGKFPKLGDGDIVGPMVQIAAQVQPKPPSRATNLLKLFNNLTLKIPGGTPTRPRTSYS